MKKVNIKESFLEITNHISGTKLFFSSYSGVQEWINDMLKPVVPVVVADEKFINGDLVASTATGEIGKYFNKDEPNQCAKFTRSVLLEAGYDIGLADPPADGYLKPYGPAFANSLCGDNLGLKISREDLLPGDLVFFDNTVSGYPQGTITHVGVYVGSGMFVHRPGKGRENEQTLLDYYSALREGRRLYKK